MSASSDQNAKAPIPAQPDERPIRILIADDHPILREGVAALITLQADMEMVGEAQTGQEALDLYAQLKPDVVLMDLQMPQMPGLQAIRAIRDRDGSARIIVLTTYSGDIQVRQALRAGAVGYLIKSSLRRELLNAIRAAFRGEDRILPDFDEPRHNGEEQQPLSPRETQVLSLVAQGHPNKQIGWRLGLSEETVKSNLKSILRKLQVRDRTHAVAKAAMHGLIDL